MILRRPENSGMSETRELSWVPTVEAPSAVLNLRPSGPTLTSVNSKKTSRYSLLTSQAVHLSIQMPVSLLTESFTQRCGTVFILMCRDFTWTMMEFGP